MVPMSDSVGALSQGLSTEPIDGPVPWSRMVLPITSEAYCDPRSLLSRIRLSTDYAAESAKPQNRHIRSSQRDNAA